MEPERQEAPFSLPSQHSVCGGWGEELDLCPEVEEPGQKEEREGEREQIRGPEIEHLMVRVWSSWHCGLLQTPYPVSFR